MSDDERAAAERLLDRLYTAPDDTRKIEHILAAFREQRQIGRDDVLEFVAGNGLQITARKIREMIAARREEGKP